MVEWVPSVKLILIGTWTVRERPTDRNRVIGRQLVDLAVSGCEWYECGENVTLRYSLHINFTNRRFVPHDESFKFI